MTHSANEITRLAEKAARGAGFPPAQAETFGRAVVQHLARDGAAEPVLAALADPNDSAILRLHLLLDDLLRALRLLGPEVHLSLHPGDAALAPAYVHLLPMGIESIRTETPDEGQPSLHLTTVPDAAPASLPPRITPPKPLMARFQALASRTYVPASEASRRSGAGAGDIDNS